MNVHELSEQQLSELKMRHYTELHGDVSYEELVSCDALVSNEEIYEAYADTVFSPDDFFCSAK